jgi:predicted nucleic acid-binding protein
VKTYVLDASALLVFLQKGASAYKVGELFKEAMRGRAEILMSSVNYGEAYGVILRHLGPERAAAAMSAIDPLPIRLVDATPAIARRTADFKFKYKLHYLDSFAACLAADHKATLATTDSDFRNAANAVAILWLKN